MSTRIYLWRALFGEKPRILLENSDFTVTSFRYDSGVEGLKIGKRKLTAVCSHQTRIGNLDAHLI